MANFCHFCHFSGTKKIISAEILAQADKNTKSGFDARFSSRPFDGASLLLKETTPNPRRGKERQNRALMPDFTLMKSANRRFLRFAVEPLHIGRGWG
jgi:hypothetical protein